MSVRAYILRKVNVDFTDEHIIFERVLDREPLFNVWHNPDIFEIFMRYGDDFSNNDAIGEIRLSRKDWMNFKVNFKNEGWTKEEIDILTQINDELEIEEDLWCECF